MAKRVPQNVCQNSPGLLMLNRLTPVKIIWGWERERENNLQLDQEMG